MENNEMTEREMVEFAAKAVGIAIKPMEVKNVEFMGDDHFIGFMTDPNQWERGWFDPLTDDGDALRLAVKLGIGFRHRAGGDGSTYPALITVFTGSFDLTEYVSKSGDEFSATRLAITKAAAEIGKRMA